MQHFDDYQLFTDTTAIYPEEVGLSISTLGLLGESGEYAEKIFNITKMRQATLHKFDQIEPLQEFKEILKLAAELGRRAENLKKSLRRGDKKMPSIVVFSTDERDDLVSELGDAQHYIARNARHLQVDLSEVAYNNVLKIADRQRRDAVEGEGDNR